MYGQQSADDFLMGGAKTPSISWRNKPIGHSVTGTIARESKVVQQTDPDDGTPLFWDDARTQPKMQLVVYIDTGEVSDDQETYPDHDGVWALYVKGKSLTDATRDAVRKAKRKGLEVGGRITVTFTGEGEQKKKAFNPPKLYRVEYVPPADQASTAYLGQGQPAAGQADPWGGGQAPAAAPAGQGGSASTQPCPPGVDPTVWAGLDETRKAGVLAAMGAAPVSDQPPF
jgi:hypothetical protein